MDSDKKKTEDLLLLNLQLFMKEINTDFKAKLDKYLRKFTQETTQSK